MRKSTQRHVERYRRMASGGGWRPLGTEEGSTKNRMNNACRPIQLRQTGPIDARVEGKSNWRISEHRRENA